MTIELLREYISAALLETYLNEKEAPSWANWFHLSKVDLGEEFEFTPRIPTSPFEDPNGIIEDDVTKRTSWAPSITDAIYAIGSSARIVNNWYIYALEKLPGEVDLQDEFKKCDKRVGSPKNHYGVDFSYAEYEDQIWDEYAKDPGRRTPAEAEAMKNRVRHDLKKCVPDANKTGEHWATKPVIARKIGTINKGANNITWKFGT